MKLREHEGKALFRAHGIATPSGVVITDAGAIPSSLTLPVVVKAQVLAGQRQRHGGVRTASDPETLRCVVVDLLGETICGERVASVLVEERIDATAEYYVSVSYDTTTRGPVIALSRAGGVNVVATATVPVAVLDGLTAGACSALFEAAGITPADRPALADVVNRLWSCFGAESCMLAEVNPLLRTADGRFVAADAKVILDDDVVQPQERRFLSLGGDLAILASGGGASLLNIDALIGHGGKPANYTEYSGNPPADVVRDLTRRVLSQPGIRGCWVVGGTANFTDIAETMRGFVEGLRAVQPKPTYPIVIRRDGPRQAEAFTMLREVGSREGYQFYPFGAEVPMEESARILVKLSYG